ncbi:MAG TPA: hypothetical protein VMI10_25810 [Terriglobales bacterium]|nr:hypothetical protein [Terriglobales bacterium]
MTAARIDQSEQDKKSRPCSEASIHHVRVAAVILPQSVIQPGHRVVIRVERIGREEAAVFGEQKEDQAQQHCQQSVIDVIGIACKDISEQLSAGLIIGGLEAAQELIQGLKHLLCELCRDDVLIFTAVGQDGR